MPDPPSEIRVVPITTNPLIRIDVSGVCVRDHCSGIAQFDRLRGDYSLACNDTSAQVLDAGNPGIHYTWSTGDTTRQVRVHGAALYWVQVTGACGLFRDSIRISQTVTPRPVIRALGPTSFCAGGSVDLTYEGSVQSPRWSTGDTQHTIRVRAAGNYWLVANPGVCQAVSDTITVTVRPPADAYAGHDTTLCENDTLWLGAQHPPLDEALYVWHPTQYLSYAFDSDPYFFNPNLRPGQEVTCWITKTDMLSQCPGTDTIRIRLAPRPASGYAGPDLDLCSGDTAQIGTIEAGIPEIFYRWIPSQWLDESTRSQTTIWPVLTDGTQLQTFQYRLQRNEMGNPCIFYDTVLVTVHPTSELKPDGVPYCGGEAIMIPNVITPNGDSYNSTFRIKGLAVYPMNSLTIYNRWGKQVLKQAPYNGLWAPEAAGIYFYRLVVPELGKTYTGWVEVVQ